jgi:Uma2 family endonuclease
MIAKTKFRAPPRIGPESNGMLLSPEEFDAIDDYDENYRYELIHGVLVVNPIPSAGEIGPNELLGNFLYGYKQYHPQGKSLDGTLWERYINVRNGRRRADRVIWTGLGRMPNERTDPPTIAVESVSLGLRSRIRDYEEKLAEYPEAGVKEYWIIDRFERKMFAHRFFGRRRQPFVVEESATYSTPLLPGVELALAPLLQCADAWSPPIKRNT